MTIFLVFKLLIVLAALVVFLRRPSLAWGIGLLTATSAVLLDTFLSTFGREEMLAELGFFFYVISGVLLGGAAVWTWSMLRPLLQSSSTGTLSPEMGKPTRTSHQHQTPTPNSSENAGTAFDRQMLFDEIRHRLGREDILDLIFDLEINENDVATLHQDMNQLIIRLMDYAEAHGRIGALALAVERILTPPPPENLPRPEKIDVDSPPTILRHYLLATYTLAQLRDMADALGVDWEQLGAGGKKEMVRNLLLHLMHRNRLDELVTLLHQGVTAVS
ncbi:MAG: hypothetical protein ACE5E7_00845 [Anaerolineae bacterium]